MDVGDRYLIAIGCVPDSIGRQPFPVVQTPDLRSGQAARVFKDLRYRTLAGWRRERRLIGKAEHLARGYNPRFVVASVGTDHSPGTLSSKPRSMTVDSVPTRLMIGLCDVLRKPKRSYRRTAGLSNLTLRLTPE